MRSFFLMKQPNVQPQIHQINSEDQFKAILQIKKFFFCKNLDHFLSLLDE